MNDLISGATVMAYAVAGVFFLRFWKRSGDVLFVFFAVAFWLLAAQRLALALTTERNEDNTAFYIVRLAAYIIILVGIVNKNRSAGSG